MAEQITSPEFQRVAQAWRAWRSALAIPTARPRSGSRRGAPPRVWRLQPADGRPIAAKVWPDEGRFRAEQAVLQLLAPETSVSAPLPLWFDPNLRVGFLEWRGDLTLAEFLLTGTPPGHTEAVLAVVEQFVALERWTVTVQAALNTLAPMTPRAPAGQVADELLRAVTQAAVLLTAEPPPPAWVGRVRDAAQGMATAAASQPLTVGVWDLSPENVVLSPPALKPAFVDFEYLGTASTAERFARLLNQPGVPVREPALALLDGHALEAFTGAGGVDLLGPAGTHSPAEIMDCSVALSYWRFIGRMAEVSERPETPDLLEVATHYGHPRSRLGAAVCRFLACPALSGTGPAASLRNLVLSARWPSLC